jgi:hypothetical protein
MDHGPELEWLTRRLTECPADFLRPLGGKPGQLNLEALVADLLRDHGMAAVAPEDTAVFVQAKSFSERAQRIVAISCWLLHDDWFLSRQRFARPVHAFLSQTVPELAAIVRPELVISDGDRREELVRLALRALDLMPAGEAEAAALDRLTTLSSVERKRVAAATRAALEHAERVRKALLEKEAAESAARFARE